MPNDIRIRQGEANVEIRPDAVLEGRAGGYPSDIHLIYSIGANYLNQGSDIKKNIRAFKQVELVVTHDLFMTPTARFSDVVLPATTSLEREDVMSPADHYLFYSHQAVEPVPGCRHDYDIFCDLADRLGFGEAYSEGRMGRQWLDHLLATSGIDDVARFRETGILAGDDQRRTGLSRFVDNPAAIKGKAVLVIEDGPTLTHGEMNRGSLRSDGDTSGSKHKSKRVPKPF